MLTLFTVAKPFLGLINTIQRNAILSWKQASAGVEIIVFGDDEGTQETCLGLHVQYGGAIARSESGRFLVSDAFEKAREQAEFETLCYLNCDILLPPNFINVVESVRKAGLDRFLICARRWLCDIDAPLDFQKPSDSDLFAELIRSSKLDRPSAIDCFCFPRSWVFQMPKFSVGDVAWDNWIVSDAIRARVPVIDATADCTLIHQNHPPVVPPHISYDRVRNLALAGKVGDLCSLRNADFTLVNGELRRPAGLNLYYKQLFRVGAFRAVLGWKRAIHQRPLSSARPTLKLIGSPRQ